MHWVAEIGIWAAMFWLGYWLGRDRLKLKVMEALTHVSVEDVSIEWDPLLKPGQTVSDRYKVMVLKSRMLSKLETIL